MNANRLPDIRSGHQLWRTSARRGGAGDEIRRVMRKAAIIAAALDDLRALDAENVEPCTVADCTADLASLTEPQRQAHMRTHGPITRWKARKAVRT